MADRKPQQPKDAAKSRAGVNDGETPNTDHTRAPDRPVDEEDVFGGHERVDKTDNVDSRGTKP